MGVQANLWTEYIPDFKQVEYMLFPRLMALSEIGWGTSDPENYAEFENRVIRHFEFLDEQNINYAKSIYNLNGKVIRSKNGISYELLTNRNLKGIRYTTDGTKPKASSLTYSQPIPITKSQSIKAAYFENEEIKSAITSQSFEISKSTGKSIELENQPSPNYSYNGALTLVDGIIGNPKILGKTWLGFEGKDVMATIDLGEKSEFSLVKFNSLDNKGSWIHLAKSATIYTSDDGKHFNQIKEVSKDEIQKSKGIMKINLNPTSARFVRIHILNAGIIPSGNPGAGSGAWLFVDEIGIE